MLLVGYLCPDKSIIIRSQQSIFMLYSANNLVGSIYDYDFSPAFCITVFVLLALTGNIQYTVRMH